MKKLLLIAYIIDIIIIICEIKILFWWKDNHNAPGLAEIKLNIVYMVIEIIVFIILTIIIIKNAKK